MMQENPKSEQGAVTAFSFERMPVRTVTADGEVWFVGSDICDALGYVNPSDAIKQHCKGVAKRYPLSTAGGMQQMRVLSEPDVMRLIVSSTLPAAERFESWIFEDVLPSIRKTGGYTAPQAKKADDGLAQFRRARAIDLSAKTAERICAQFPKLGDAARQCVFAKLVNPIVGDEVIALPRVDGPLMNATEVGRRFGATANAIGRLANAHGLKTAEYGEYVIDKSAHSDKQVQCFLYNQRGVDAIGRLLGAIEQEAA
ncbi:Phage antirepressor protein [Thauera humireducens]|uniref:BRO-N domain-containing protein n=1 Tax=Thauera humireducens TaxID=1134435 RepID=UPI002467A98C|nr:Bro-N domain-containing protein [Thauera humireducens]CAH1747466.1 Phage antirepressor protein [Thauera humireducens]